MILCNPHHIARCSCSCVGNVSMCAVSGKGPGTHSPPLTLFLPKLLPTVPLHLQVWPAAFVHVAVAVDPIARHVIACTIRTTLKQARIEMDVTCILVEMV